MRQFIWGIICGLAFWYAYEKLDPPAIFAYLTQATESAARATSGYAGGRR
ncbi:MAG: hypothetical protein KatS3mg077_1451 [Candidatus Binatia bacterium]|nr:MAG: hypothetical protein KatS3mg077_1451 [Candidatus Binatia bacterium]